VFFSCAWTSDEIFIPDAMSAKNRAKTVLLICFTKRQKRIGSPGSQCWEEWGREHDSNQVWKQHSFCNQHGMNLTTFLCLAKNTKIAQRYDSDEAKPLNLTFMLGYAKEHP
jgi:hypothetical protein